MGETRHHKVKFIYLPWTVEEGSKEGETCLHGASRIVTLDSWD